jgi:hypothetical protein
MRGTFVVAVGIAVDPVRERDCRADQGQDGTGRAWVGRSMNNADMFPFPRPAAAARL